MDKALTFTRYYSVPKPSFGYQVGIKRAVTIRKTLDDIYTYDNGAEYDYRDCTFKIIVEKDNIENIARGLVFGEAEDITYRMMLPHGSGFYPAGADYGDSGNFEFKMLKNLTFSSMKTTPFGMIEVGFNILFTQLPMKPPLPNAEKDAGGKFTFGAVTEIRDPKIEPTQLFGIKRSVTLGGIVNDVAQMTNKYQTKLTITTTTDKMAQVANQLSLYRGDAPIRLNAGVNYWLWGGIGNQSGDDYAYIMDKDFLMTHSGVDKWSVPIQLQRETGSKEWEAKNA